VVFDDFFHPGYETAVDRTEAVLYLVIVSLLTVSALAYPLSRLGFLYRTKTHHRPGRAILDQFCDATTPTLTTIIPSYQEDARCCKGPVLHASSTLLDISIMLDIVCISNSSRRAAPMSRTLKQEDVLATARKGQEIMADAIRTWVETVRTATPRLSSVYAPFADRLAKVPSVYAPLASQLPRAEAAVASAYDLAERLLASQRKFAEDVVKATRPLMPGFGASQPQDHSEPAPQEPVTTEAPEAAAAEATPAKTTPAKTTPAKGTAKGTATARVAGAPKITGASRAAGTSKTTTTAKRAPRNTNAD